MSPRTIYLGRLLGLYCLILAIAMMSHRQASIDIVTAMVHEASVLELTAIMAMVVGLAIILAHNVWSGGAAPVLVTLGGWISLVKGLVFMFLPPATSIVYFDALRYAQFFYFYMSITLVIGLYLTYASFRASR